MFGHLFRLKKVDWFENFGFSLSLFDYVCDLSQKIIGNAIIESYRNYPVDLIWHNAKWSRVMSIRKMYCIKWREFSCLEIQVINQPTDTSGGLQNYLKNETCLLYLHVSNSFPLSMKEFNTGKKHFFSSCVK